MRRCATGEGWQSCDCTADTSTSDHDPSNVLLRVRYLSAALPIVPLPRRVTRASVVAVTAALFLAVLGSAVLHARRQPGGPGAVALDLARRTASVRPHRGSRSGTPSRAACCRTSKPDDRQHNVESLRYIVTDGSTFTESGPRHDVQRAHHRHRRHGVRGHDDGISGRWRLVTEYVTTPCGQRVMRNAGGTAGSLPTQLTWVRRDVNGWWRGEGGKPSSVLQPRHWFVRHSRRARPQSRLRCSALWRAAATVPSATTSGFAGSSSDGLLQLDSAGL